MLWLWEIQYSVQNIERMDRKKANTLISLNTDLIDNLRKKRATMPALDLEKLLQQSVELSDLHRKLSDENQTLHKECQQLEDINIQRQQFISRIEQIVKQRSHLLCQKGQQQTSWLVLKLQQKIFTLRQQLETKDKAIQKLQLSKDNQVLFKKEIEMGCLKQINEYVDQMGLTDQSEDDVQQENGKFAHNLEQIVWMDDYLDTEKERIEELESQLEQEDRFTRRMMATITIKKAEIKRLRQIERECLTVEQNFMKEKKKKQQKTTDNKSYISNLMKQRDLETERLQSLKQKRAQIQKEESAQLQKLSARLQMLQVMYKDNKNMLNDKKIQNDVCIKNESKEQWVKRVSIGEVEMIAKNLNMVLALKGVDQEKWVSLFFADESPLYSIEIIIRKLGEFPFQMTNLTQKTLLARYVVEDNDAGLMLQDMNTSQDAPIIKSILIKLIGPIKVYSSEQCDFLRQELGTKLSKYWSLVEQSVHIKEGVRNEVTREMLLEGLNEAELEMNESQQQFIVLYLFSWSRNVNKLELNKLGKLKELGVNFYSDN